MHQLARERCRKLFDGRAVQSSMTGEELLAVCFKIRASHEQGPVGALAIVCTPEQTVEFARLLGALAAADRPIGGSTSFCSSTDEPPLLLMGHAEYGVG